MIPRLLLLAAAILVLGDGLIARQAHDPRLPIPGLTPLGNGVWRLTVEQLVGPSDYVHDVVPECSGDYTDRGMALLLALRGPIAKNPKIGLLIPIAAQFLGDLARFARTQGGDLGQWYAPDRYANCVPIGLMTGPATILRVTYWVSDGDRGAGQCTNLVNENLLTCEPIGWAGWEDPVPPGTQVQVGFVSSFKNWSHDRHRWGNLSVDFQPPPGVTPSLQ